MKSILRALKGHRGNVLICGFDNHDRQLLETSAMMAGCVSECVTLEAVDKKLFAHHYDFLLLNVTPEARPHLLRIGALLVCLPERERQTFPVAVFSSRQAMEEHRGYLSRMAPAYLMQPLDINEAFMIFDSLPQATLIDVHPDLKHLGQEDVYLPDDWPVAA